MVIVIVAAPATGGMAIGRALASELGWPFVDASTGRESVASVHAMIARTLGRREHMVIACAALRPHEMGTLKGDLKTVRFVCLEETANRASPPDDRDDALRVDAATPSGELFAAIWREFGF
jgi:gluconate kinase